MASFSTDVPDEPLYIDFIDIAAGYGILGIPIDGLLPGDVPQAVALVISPTAGGSPILSLSVDMVQRTDGYFLYQTQDSINALFTLSAANVAIISAGSYSYSCSITVLRSGQTISREVQSGTIAARTASGPVPPLIVNSITMTGGPLTGAAGDTAQLTATLYDGWGNVITTQSPAWQSLSPLIASVDQSGLVTFVTPGVATIIASSQSVQASTTATTNDPHFASPSDMQVAGYLTANGYWAPATLTAEWIQPGTFGGTSGDTYTFPGPIVALSFAGSGAGLTDLQSSELTGAIPDALIAQSSVVQYEADLAIGFGQLTGLPTTLGGYGIADAYTKTASDALYAAIAGPFPWSDLSGVPTTVGGYGITDAYTKTESDALYALLAGPFPWADVSGTPTTLGGYGIGDAYTKTESDGRYAPITVPWASLSGVPTTIGGYGITDFNSLGDMRWSPLAGSSSIVTVGVLVSPHMTGAIVDSGGLKITTGGLGVGAPPNASAVIYAFGANLTGTSQYGLYANTNSTSSATVELAGVYTAPNYSTSFGTMPVMAGVHIATSTKAAFTTVTTNYGLLIDNQTVGGTNYAIYTSTGSISFGDMVTIRSGGLAVTGNLGFYGTAAIAKQTISGSRGSIAALTSLLTALAALGLVTDSTT